VVPPNVKISTLFLPNGWLHIKGVSPQDLVYTTPDAAGSPAKRKAGTHPSDGSPGKRHMPDGAAAGAVMIRIQRGHSDDAGGAAQSNQHAAHPDAGGAGAAAFGADVVMVRVQRSGASNGAVGGPAAVGAVGAGAWTGQKTIYIRRVAEGDVRHASDSRTYVTDGTAAQKPVMVHIHREGKTTASGAAQVRNSSNSSITSGSRRSSSSSNNSSCTSSSSSSAV
jgi:hypothetical protein